jgi:Uri superfamily endonuclease
MKCCTTCNITKEFTLFYIRSKYKDGFSTWCKECTLNYGKAYKAPRLLDRLKKQRIWRKDTNYPKLYLSNINNRIAHSIRTRLSKAVKGNLSAIDNLGCSISELKTYLETKFQPGMNWNNYGEWHIDHIKPLSKFDLTNDIEFKLACCFNNLQPLWAKDNLVKYNNMEKT